MSTHTRSSPRTDDAAPEPERYLTVPQAAQILSVHPSTIRRWIDQGRLPAYRLGPKRIAVRAHDLTGVIAPRSAGSEIGGVDIEDRITFPPLSVREQRRILDAV